MYDKENGLVIDLTEALDLSNIGKDAQKGLDKMFQESHDTTLPEEIVLERGDIDEE
jgi:hypothetical protein